MSRAVRRLAAALALLPAPALAQNGAPGLLDLLTPERILQHVLQSGVMALRTQMDIKYEGLSVDLALGHVSLTDLRAWPLPPWDAAGDCEVTADRLTLGTSPLGATDRIRLKAQIVGATFGAVCLPREPRGALAMAGLETVTVPRLTLDLDYRVGGSEALMHLYAEVAGAAAVDLTADFSYFWFDGREDMEEPVPVMFLESAALSIENMGLWQAVSAQLPPQYTDPEGAGLLVEGMLGGALTQMNREAAGAGGDADPSRLSPAQRAFLDSAVEAWPAFLANPEALVVETGIDGDVYIDLEAIEDDPRVLFAALNPRVALASARRGDMLPAALLTQALGPSAGQLSDAARREVGIALVTGVGAPRNREAGFGLLNPLAKAGDGEAALAMAAALETRQPADAYRWALIAGATGEAGATARLDRIEGRLALADILALQRDVTDLSAGTPPEAGLASVAAMRERAAMRLSGVGLARSYQVAAFWAMLASAAGDAEAALMLDEIDQRVRLGGAEAETAWAGAEAVASTRATEIWIGRDLPAALGR